MSKCAIAIIAEDDTDCDTIRKIIHRVIDPSITTKKWVSRGCGILKRKLSIQLKAMADQGYNAFIVIHGLDRNPQNGSLNDELELRKILEKSSANLQNINKHICIPIEELEARF